MLLILLCVHLRDTKRTLNEHKGHTFILEDTIRTQGLLPHFYSKQSQVILNCVVHISPSIFCVIDDHFGTCDWHSCLYTEGHKKDTQCTQSAHLSCRAQYGYKVFLPHFCSAAITSGIKLYCAHFPFYILCTWSWFWHMRLIYLCAHFRDTKGTYKVHKGAGCSWKTQ